jgi:hypothetical protein
MAVDQNFNKKILPIFKHLIFAIAIVVLVIQSGDQGMKKSFWLQAG